jgi:hypothetical protein
VARCPTLLIQTVPISLIRFTKEAAPMLAGAVCSRIAGSVFEPYLSLLATLATTIISSAASIGFWNVHLIVF